jgi:hypothetical protein
MNQQRSAASTPDELPEQWYCRECDALLPRERFTPQSFPLKDGSRRYYFSRQCTEHRHAYNRRWMTLHRRPSRGRETPQEAAERLERARRKVACIAFVQRYVAGLWEHEPAWLPSPDRDPDHVEARALVMAILHREHGIGITETARVIKRDHSTALHLLAKFEPQPEFQELLADYRDMRARRKAARAQRAS